MGQRDRYTPRRSQQERRRHPLRNILIVLLILCCAAFAVLRWGIPLWLDYVTPDSDSGIQSSQASEDLPPAETSSDGTVPAPSGADAAGSDGAAQPDAPAASSAAGQDSSSGGQDSSGETDGEIDLLMLVNSTHPLPEGYTVELTELSNGQSVATLIYPALQQMFDDARAAGVYPIVASGYRTPEKQQSLMDEKIQSLTEEGYSQEEAAAEALRWVNQVGYSEHQSGLAVDINADGIHSAGYEVYDWLAQNAWRYGFILRYPEDKTEVTGTGYEPWHYRYVGVENAQAITESGLCLEEYLGAA